MALTLPVKDFERFYIALKDERGILVPLAEGDQISVDCEDPRINIELDDEVSQDPQASANHYAASGVVHLNTKPHKDVEVDDPVESKPFDDRTKEDNIHMIRKEELAHWPTQKSQPHLEPIQVSATYHGKDGESIVVDTITPGHVKSGKLFGSSLPLVIPNPNS